MTTTRFTSRDLEVFPNDGRRYEIVDGELIMSRQPHWNHQYASYVFIRRVDDWSRQNNAGRVNVAPGIIFDDDDDVAPDAVWISNERLKTMLQSDCKLHGAPELVIEILSSGNANENRDREAKRKLYSRRGVTEYWLISWPMKRVEVFRRNGETAVLELAATFYENDTLRSALLPGFSCALADLFAELA